MNILLAVHHHLDPDAGAPGVTLALGRAYEEAGHRVRFLSFDDLPGRLPALGAEQLFPLQAAASFARASATRKIDVIDASTGDAWLWGLLRRGRRSRPLLVTRSHGLEHLSWPATLAEARAAGQRLTWRTSVAHGPLRLWQVAVSLRRADACLFLNRDDRAYATERLGVEPPRAHVVVNGLPDYLIGRPLQRAGEPVRLAHVGTHAPAKGSRYLDPAVATLLERHPQLAVTFLGSGSPREKTLAALPAAVRPRVAVVARYTRPDLPTLLAGHQIVLSASVADAFGLGLLESMACGLAPVASAVSGTRELVRDGVNGLLVRPKDSDALVAAVSSLLDDRQRLEDLRQAAHQSAQGFSLRSVAQGTLALYERELERRDRTA